MSQAAPKASQRVQFGTFVLDVRAGELHHNGHKVKLQEQPLRVLLMLLEHPGAVVTREELQQRLWPDGTFVDFEHSLNAAIKRLREALDDTADNPRFVETVHRRGYRFIAPVEGLDSPSALRRSRVRRYLAFAAVAVVLAAALLVGLNLSGLRDRLLGRPLAGEITSIAVLPLENLSGDPEQEYFADGMTEALITELGQISALRVISRTSALRYKERKKPLPEIARELDVDAVVEGSVAREGNRVRVTAQLIQVQPERHLWAQSYERDLAGILALQGEMARTIAKQIKVTLTPEEQIRLGQAGPVNPEAYEAYAKGRFLWNERTDENVRKSVEYLEKAVEKDPTYAMAHAALSEAYVVCAFRGLLPGPETLAKAEAAALRALELDGTLGEAHAALAGVHVNLGNLEASVREFQRAIELDPSSVTARVWYAETLTEMGRHGDALRELRRALEIDPVSFVANSRFGEVFYYARRYDESIAQYRKALELYPNHPNLYWGLWHSYFEKGMYDDAVAVLLKAVELEKTPPEELAAYEKAYRDRGIKGIVRHRLEVLKRSGTRPWAIACNYARLGEKDLAFQHLDFENPAVRFVIRVGDPCFDSLRSDPRFQDLLRRLNLPGDVRP